MRRAPAAWRGYRTTTGERPSLTELATAVAADHGLTLKELLHRSLFEHIARPRLIAMWAGRSLLDLNYCELGRFFHRHRTTVMSACQRIEKEIARG
jgi:chromosomal replication initiation ATPase DnaA